MLQPENRALLLRRRSPVNLRYVTALRGIEPHEPGQPFVYGEIGCRDVEDLLAFAASNPEGTFIGFYKDAASCATAKKIAEETGLGNVSCHALDLPGIVESARKGQIPAAGFDFLYHDCFGAEPDDPSQLFTAADLLLKPGGVFSVDFQTFDSVLPDASLHFAANHFAARQKTESLQDLRALGSLYFAGAPEPLRLLDQAIASNDPGVFFARYGHDKAEPVSLTAAFIHAGQKVGLANIGSANIRSNYLELSIPQIAQKHIVSHEGEADHQALKDFATCARTRADIWIKPPFKATDSHARRFGRFHFLIAQPLSSIGNKQDYFGYSVDFAGPVYDKILPILTHLPATIGDLIQHPSLHGISAADIITAVQLLTATGIAEPVRTTYQGRGGVDTQSPKFNGGWNQRVRTLEIGERGVLFAAPALGRPSVGKVLMALTLRSIDLGGLTGAEEILDGDLAKLPASITRQIEGDMETEQGRRDVAFHLLEQACKEWLLYGFMTGILES